MHVPTSLYARKHSYSTPLTNDLYRKSFYQRLKRSSHDDEQLLRSSLVEETESIPKRKSTNSSSSFSTTNMQTTTTTDETNIGVPSRSCSVCGDISTGIHFGGNSCESCKAFFRRSVQCNRYQNYKCSNDEHCPVNIVTRKVCQYCRYMKCTAIGMKPKWVLSDQEREEKYGSRRKRFRENRATEEDPDIYKYLTKDEKSLIEDIAHALYQSRATYPLQIPAQLKTYLTSLSNGAPPPPPPSAGADKPANPSANFLTVPIQRLVLFARMLKDFNLFSEDDKVNLLKGSAIEMIVCSSNTLFDPKSHTFTNYLSRDQRAVMDDQVIPLDPLLMRLWGEELFVRTRAFLISMCNLHVDEVTSTLLTPVILFSPDRSNITDLDLVKRLQMKYVTLLRKYMNWRYGMEQTDLIYPKLLLQIVNIRTLSLAHAEIIQKVMATTSVNPLVQEVTVKQEPINQPSSDKADTLSSSSMPTDSEMMDYDKTSSIDTESNLDSDDDESNRKKPRSSIDEDDDSSETKPTNIWRKRKKLSAILQAAEITNIEEGNSPKALQQHPYQKMKDEYTRSNSIDAEKYSPSTTQLYRRPHDHQVPNFVSSHRGHLHAPNRSSSFRHLPLKKQSLLTKHEQFHLPHSSSATDLTSLTQQPRANQTSTSTMSLTSQQYYPEQFYDNYRQQYARMSSANIQQQHNEQHLLLLSLAATNQSQSSPAQSTNVYSGVALDTDEQQLLDAIHAHPNKRDLVLNLLRQMNESSQTSSSPATGYHRPDLSNPYNNPYLHHSDMDDQNN